MTSTPEPDALRELKPKQRIALCELVAGATQQHAADKAGVQRTTVNAWVNHHPGFRAALDSQLHATNSELLSIRQAGSVMILAKLFERVKDGDEEAFKLWLRFVGVSQIPESALGPTDPDAVIDNEVDQLMERENAQAATEWVDSMLPATGVSRDTVATAYEQDLTERFEQLDSEPPEHRGTGTGDKSTP